MIEKLRTKIIYHDVSFSVPLQIRMAYGLSYHCLGSLPLQTISLPIAHEGTPGLGPAPDESN